MVAGAYVQYHAFWGLSAHQTGIDIFFQFQASGLSLMHRQSEEENWFAAGEAQVLVLNLSRKQSEGNKGAAGSSQQRRFDEVY